MAGNFGETPRGLSDLKVLPLGASDTPGAAVDVPGARQLSFKVASDADELEGDNTVIAIARNAKKLTGSIELGKINLAALAVMVGGTVSTTGVAPKQVSTLDETDDIATIYFQAKGVAPSQDVSGAGYLVTVHKIMITGGPDETMGVNAWNTPTLDFEGVALAGKLVTRAQYQDMSDISFT